VTGRTTARPAPGNRPPGWQQAHARRYIETGGQDGHIWEGVTTRLLTTTGRRSGEPMTAIWPPYADYQARTAREIPFVIIERL
jgi:hypothetical protein